MNNTHFTFDEFLQDEEDLAEDRLRHLKACSECGAIARTKKETRIPEGLDVREVVREAIEASFGGK